MKFDCGVSYETWKKQRETWHPHFALTPVFIADHDCRWLETVQRRGTEKFGKRGTYWKWEYKGMEQP